MKKKGQRTFNNENVHRIIMLGLPLYPLYSPWLLDIFHQRGEVIDSSPASKNSAPSETKGAFHLRKKPGNFGGSKPRCVAVPYRGPGTGTNFEKRKWNTTFRSEISTGKTGPPF